MNKDLGDGLADGQRLADLLAAADASDPIGVRSREGEIIELALGAFDTAIASVKVAQDGGAAREAMAGLYTEEMLLALGVAFRCRPGAIHQRLFGLKQGPKGLAGDISALTRAIKQAAVEATPTEPGSLGALMRPLGVRGLVAPPGWSVDARGVWKAAAGGKEENVARMPFVITGLAADLDTSEMRVRVAWRRGSRWHRHEIDRRTASEARSLVELATVGAPVSSSNAADLVRYLADFEAANLEALPKHNITQHFGWQKDDTFLASAERDDLRLAVGPGESKFARGWGETAGTWERWCELISEYVAPYPLPLLGLYGACVPVVLQLLDQQGFTMDWSGETSHGKTTTLRIAASVWGYPDDKGRGIVRKWDASSDVGPSTYAAMLANLPLILDDTQHMVDNKKKRTAVGTMLYGIVGGQERIRSNRGKNLRVSKEWRTCMLSTGEAAITSFSNAGGAVARALCFRGSPYPDGQGELVKTLTRELLSNYGHLGPRFAELVRTQGDMIKALWKELEREHQEAGASGVADRLGVYVALLHLVARLIHEDLGVPGDSGAAIEAAMVAAQLGAVESDRPAEALRDLHGWASSNLEAFYMDGERNRSPRGEWLGRWDASSLGVLLSFAVRPQLLREHLTRWGYDYDNVVSAWRDRGWLHCSSKRLTQSVRIDKTKTWMVKVLGCDEVLRVVNGSGG